MLRSRFQSLPGAFNASLIPADKAEQKKKGLKATFSRRFRDVSCQGVCYCTSAFPCTDGNIMFQMDIFLILSFFSFFFTFFWGLGGHYGIVGVMITNFMLLLSANRPRWVLGSCITVLPYS